MKTLKSHTGIAVIVTAALLTLGSCRKKEKEAINPGLKDTEQTTTADNNLAESIVSDIEVMGSQVTENGSLTTFKTSGGTSASGTEVLAIAPCATVSGIGTATVIVDFGTGGCLGTDGRTRTGKLIYDFSASTPATSTRYRNPGFSMHITSQNYVVDSNQVNIINKTVTNTTPANIPATTNPGVNLTWAVNASVSIIKANGGSISWTCTRTKELANTSNANCYKGQGQAIDWTKAIIKINGTSNGTNAMGESFSATATNMMKDFNCAPNPLRPQRHPFISGTISYTPGTRPVRLVDFGNGACDFGGTVTINGQTFVITLP